MEKRENAKCLNCGSLERHRLMFIYINEKLNIFNNRSKDKIRLLHFAPEKMFYNIFSENKGIDSIIKYVNQNKKIKTNLRLDMGTY